MYVLIEMEGLDVRGVSVYADRASADAAFDTRAYAEHALEDTDLSLECPGTLRFAGDDVWAVQLVQAEP